MPIYEFACHNCGEKFETLVRSGDRRGMRCPACSSRRVVRVMSIFSCLGVQLTKKFRREAEEGLKEEKKY
ncbi:MAG: zinc ribbon domain-containing protein [Deltaproteobacteria bacterium]|nr:zinc ribbon domain-containing protein [Deltaproteobacteria bacterium]